MFVISASLRSCLDVYIENEGERAKAERELAKTLHETWSSSQSTCETLSALHEYLEDTEHDKQARLARARITGHETEEDLLVGCYFESELFAPLRRAITLASRAFSFPAHTIWMLCLDEAEFLEPLHHRILNSHLRANPGNLVFKITTMPYYHHTLETNTGASLNVGHDFEYIYIDKDPLLLVAGEDGGYAFARALFNKRAELSAGDYSWADFEQMLGPSALLDPKISDWAADSKMMVLLRKYANPVTLERATRLAFTPQFKDQIARKMHGALLLKDAVARIRGRTELDVYSGVRMAIHCSDANPRRLIRIFNLFISENAAQKGVRLAANRQTKLLIGFSTSALSRVQSEPKNGTELFKFLSTAGNYMRQDLHENKLGTDQISSIDLDKPVTDQEWGIIKDAVGLGLLYPNIQANSGDQMPERTGIFRLAYVLAPTFRILPRKGKPVPLSRIIQQINLPIFRDEK